MPDLRKMGFGNSYKGSHVIKGRTQYQAPEIDGNVFITEGIARPGQIVPVLIKDAGNYDLIGEIVKN
jgi:ribosomal protein S12 methylthiotransferase